MAQYKFFAKDKIPDGAYKDVKGVETIAVGAQWTTTSKQPDDLVYEITKALWSDKTRAAMDAGHAKGKDIKKETALQGVGIPLHAGAEKFYKEVGPAEVTAASSRTFCGGGMTTAAELDDAKIQKLEAELDPEMRFRPLLPAAAWIVAVALFGLSCFHYYTAGFGLLPETLHRGIHIACVLGLIFLVFSWNQKGNAATPIAGVLRAARDRHRRLAAAAIAAVVTSLYVPYVFHDLQFRVGNPDPIDWIMGTIMIVVLLEATRRSVGWPLPIIAVVLIVYALYGPSLPGILAHPGNTWKSVVNHLYLTSQGIYGIALGVVATYVFHYVLFGVLATRVGLGRFFIDLATALTGRFSGGPAKVSIFGSGLFGMISGSSIANTVTVGSLTIPAMIRVGYARHFAGAVEAAAATGGQITPPIMGAAAFLMVEYLAVPYQTIIVAAIVPAFMHFFGVFCQIHFEAKKYGLRGLPRSELPIAREVIRRDWPTAMPLAVLLMVLFSDFTPYLAAYWGITGCIVLGLTNRNPLRRGRVRGGGRALHPAADPDRVGRPRSDHRRIDCASRPGLC